LAAGESSVIEVDEAGNINTPLLLAAKEEHFAMSHWLLEFGLISNFKDKLRRHDGLGFFDVAFGGDGSEIPSQPCRYYCPAVQSPGQACGAVEPRSAG
jgi:hypothetical protein